MTNINCNIEYLAHHTAHQFTLGMRFQLVMETSKHALTRFRVVILHKFNFMSYHIFEDLLTEAFKEKTTVITKDPRLKNKYIWNLSFNNIHYLVTFNHLQQILTVSIFFQRLSQFSNLLSINKSFPISNFFGT